jgi:electron transfer flavoprotein beta subunit
VNIIVCVKQVPNPEIPMGKFRIDTKTNSVIPPEGVPPVISPFDEQAVEAALRLKEQCGGKITAITMGVATDVLKHAISMGADEGIILEDEAFANPDSFSTAYVLTCAIRRIGEYDLILCGRQAADWDAGQVGIIIAENLGIPAVTFARKIEAIGGGIRVERVLIDGSEVLEAPTPALVTVSNEIGQPRLPTGWGIIAAARKKLPSWNAEEIGAELSRCGAAGAHTELLKLFIPERAEKCQLIGGETVAQAAANLALKLRENKLI